MRRMKRRRRSDGVCRGQVRGSCSYLWANTACLFSAGKHGLLHKCAHRSGVRADIYYSTKMTSRFSPSFCVTFEGRSDGRRFLRPFPPRALTKSSPIPQAGFVNVFVLRCYALRDGLSVTRRHSASHFIFVWALGQDIFSSFCFVAWMKKKSGCFTSPFFQVLGSSLVQLFLTC